MPDENKPEGNKSADGENSEPHQHQAGTSTTQPEDQWKHRPPYRVHENPSDFPAPFQWAAIFHKEDINFTNGHHDLGWTPIMDEGRNMILLFPTLIEGINTKEGIEAFKAQCHMFYSQRVVDVKDGLPKWEGMNDDSPLLHEETGEKIPDSGPNKRQKREE
ncbi:hypothetical protein OQA88_7452 [Cercophora sp. LCS_1]